MGRPAGHHARARYPEDMTGDGQAAQSVSASGKADEAGILLSNPPLSGGFDGRRVYFPELSPYNYIK